MKIAFAISIICLMVVAALVSFQVQPDYLSVIDYCILGVRG